MNKIDLFGSIPQAIKVAAIVFESSLILV